MVMVEEEVVEESAAKRHKGREPLVRLERLVFEARCPAVCLASPPSRPGGVGLGVHG